MTVGFAVERRKDALAVPVKALLARQGGGYAVELAGDAPPGGGRRPALFADDWVEVDGGGPARGHAVVVTAR